MSWFKRRALTLFSLALRIKHTTDEAGVEHIVIDQVVSGIPALRDVAVVGGQEQEREHFLFGLMTTKTRRVAVEELSDEYLKGDLTQDAIDDGVFVTESWSTPDKNNYTWRNIQVTASSLLVASFSTIQQTRYGASVR